MERADEVQYTTPNGGTLAVRYDRPGWLLNDNGTEHRFTSVPQWMGYIRDTYSWPLPTKAII